jgi:pyruvate,orthophosphate dikinase
MAIEAVFRSWNNPRAISYRRLNNIPHDLGTGVNVQTMVFGQHGLGFRHGRRLHPRPPQRASRVFTPNICRTRRARMSSLASERRWTSNGSPKNMPHIYEELLGYAKRLEEHYKDMQDIEFTVEKGKLYILQTRTGKTDGHRRHPHRRGHGARRTHHP